MKGIIVYSSKTGNTKRMAEAIYKEVRNKTQVEIVDIREKRKLEDYDFALVGAWVDRAKPDGTALNLIKRTSQKNLGLFVTMGAMPQSEHGEDVLQNLENLLEEKNSLGTYICPGIVDPKLIKRIRGLAGKVVPAKIRDKMIEAGINSRYATEEELQKAAIYFVKNISQIVE